MNDIDVEGMVTLFEDFMAMTPLPMSVLHMINIVLSEQVVHGRIGEVIRTVFSTMINKNAAKLYATLIITEEFMF